MYTYSVSILALHFSLDVVFFIRLIATMVDLCETPTILSLLRPSLLLAARPFSLDVIPEYWNENLTRMIEPHPLTPATGGPHSCNSPAGTRGAFSVQHEHLELHSSPLWYLQLPGTQQL